MDITPKTLSKELGISEKRIRVFLRKTYRPGGQDKYARWVLDDQMAAVVRQHFHDR